MAQPGGVIESPRPVETTDLHFKLIKRNTTFPYAGQPPPTYANLVAVAHSLGLSFVGTIDGFLVVQTNSLENDDFPRKEILLRNRPTHLAVSCDESLLAVGYCTPAGSAATIYNLTTLPGADLAVVRELRLSTTGAAGICDLVWNPAVPALLSACLSDGSVVIIELKGAGIEINNLPPAASSRCLCWSPKGKQIVVGGEDGKLTQYKPDLKPAKALPAPPLFGGAVAVVNVLWISNFQFGAYYRHRGKPDESPVLVIINAPKNEPVSFINYYDITYGSTGFRCPQFYFNFLQAWNLILVGSANAVEIAVLHLGADGKTWEQWTVGDSSRAELPLSSSQEETYPLGLAVDLSSHSQVPWVQTGSELHPMPRLLLLSQEGRLCLFNVILLGAPGICSPVKQLVPDRFFDSVIKQDVVGTVEPERQEPPPPSAANVPEMRIPPPGPPPPVYYSPVPQQPPVKAATPPQFFPTTIQQAPVVRDTQPAPVYVKPAESVGIVGASQSPPPKMAPKQAPPPDPVAPPPPPQAEEPADNEVDEAVYDAAIADEVNALQDEISAVLTEGASQNLDLGSEEKFRGPVQRLAVLQDFKSEVEETTVSQAEEVAELKLGVLEQLARLEDARLVSSRRGSSLSSQLRRTEQLDPVTARTVRDILSHRVFIETQMRQVGDHLDRQWEEHQASCRKDAKERLKTPMMDDTVKTIELQKKLVRGLTAEVEKLKKLMVHRNASAGWPNRLHLQPDQDSSRSNELSKLAESLLDMNISKSGDKDGVADLVLKAKRQHAGSTDLPAHDVTLLLDRFGDAEVPEVSHSLTFSEREAQKKEVMARLKKAADCLKRKKDAAAKSREAARNVVATGPPISTIFGSGKAASGGVFGFGANPDSASKFYFDGVTATSGGKTAPSATSGITGEVSTFSSAPVSGRKSPVFKLTSVSAPESASAVLGGKKTTAMFGDPKTPIFSLTDPASGLPMTGTQRGATTAPTKSLAFGAGLPPISSGVFGGGITTISSSSNVSIGSTPTTTPVALYGGRKSPPSALSGGTVSTATSTIFGGQKAPAGGVFGGGLPASKSTGIFSGVTTPVPTPIPATTTAKLTGTPPSGLFSSVATPTTTSSSLFGATTSATSSSSQFGVLTSTASVPSNPSLFAAPFNPTISSSMFGASSFGSSAPLTTESDVLPATTTSTKTGVAPETLWHKADSNEQKTVFGSVTSTTSSAEISTSAEPPITPSPPPTPPGSTVSLNSAFASTFGGEVKTPSGSLFGTASGLFSTSTKTSDSSAPSSTGSSTASIFNSSPANKTVVSVLPVRNEPTPAATVKTSVVAPSPTTTSATSTPGAFSFSSVPPSTSTPAIFGATTSASIFGTAGRPVTVEAPSATVTTPVSSAPTTGAPTFGTPATTSSAPAFGAPASPSAFSSPATVSAFSSPTTAAPGIFAAAATGLFGATPAPSSPSIFGAAATTSSPGTGLFGSFAASTTSSFGGFGATTTTSPSVFSTPSTTATTAGFGTDLTQTTNLFGQMLGGTTSPGSPSGGIFGQATPTKSTFDSGGSIFGSAPASTTPSAFGSGSGNVFGQSTFGTTTTATPSIFGQTTATTSASTFFGQGMGSPFGAGTAAPNQSPFGNTAATTQNTFGSSPFSKPVFGQSLFGQSGTSVFGGGTSGGSGSIFGGGATGESVFQAGAAPGPFSGGGGSVAQSGFTKSPGGFGSAPVFGGAPASGFGAAPTFGGSPAFSETSAFGGTPKVFGSPATQAAPLFGGMANQNTGGFGSLAQMNQGAQGFGGFATTSPTFGSPQQQPQQQQQQQQQQSQQPSSFGGNSFSSWR